MLFSPFAGWNTFTANGSKLNRSKFIPASAVLKDRYFGRIQWVQWPPHGAASGAKGGFYEDKEFYFNIGTFVVGAVYYIHTGMRNSQQHEAAMVKQDDMICEIKKIEDYLERLSMTPPPPPPAPAPRAPTSLVRLLCPVSGTHHRERRATD